MKEEWKPISGWPNYLVSSMGRVKSLKNDRILKPGGEKPCVNLYAGVGVPRARVYVHALVLEAFVGPRPPQHESKHLDGDFANNKLSNLAWRPNSERKRGVSDDNKLRIFLVAVEIGVAFVFLWILGHFKKHFAEVKELLEKKL